MGRAARYSSAKRICSNPRGERTGADGRSFYMEGWQMRRRRWDGIERNEAETRNIIHRWRCEKGGVRRGERGEQGETEQDPMLRKLVRDWSDGALQPTDRSNHVASLTMYPPRPNPE